jgi:hypothetical protein
MSQFLLFLVSALAIILALTLAFMHANAEPTNNRRPQADTPVLPPLGDKAGSTLLTLFQDFYRQEVAAEEDVHRSLPFFGTALGLFITALTYVAAQLPDWATVLNACSADHHTFSWDVITCARAWSAGVASVFLLVSALEVVSVLWSLRLATTPRGYDRVGPEREYIIRAHELRDYHAALGLTNEAHDSAVNLDIRDQLLQDFTTVLPHNRGISIKRYNFRARAFRHLLWGLFLALLATIIILITAKVGLLPAKGLP